MATISVTIPNAQLTRVVNAVAVAKNYQATIDGSPNPESKQDFVRRMVVEQLKLWVARGEQQVTDVQARVAADAAFSAVISDATLIT